MPAEAAGIDAAAPTASTEAPVGTALAERVGVRATGELGLGALGIGRARLESIASIARVARPTVSPAVWVPAPSANEIAAAKTAGAPSNFESCRSGQSSKPASSGWRGVCSPRVIPIPPPTCTGTTRMRTMGGNGQPGKAR